MFFTAATARSPIVDALASATLRVAAELNNRNGNNAGSTGWAIA
jgi:hypothetical protein